MPTKTLSIISSVVTVVLLIILAILSFFVTLVMLNGYGDREGGPALIAFGICQGIGLILSAILSARLTRIFLEKYNWNAILAVIVSVLAGAVTGGGLGIVSFFVSIVVAEAIR
jgi:hypothetical protein